MNRINDKPHTIFRYQLLMDKERRRLFSGKSWADRTGIIVSAFCFLHCWSMPLMLLVFPELLYGEAFVHPVLGGLAVFSAVLFVRNHTYRKHQNIMRSAAHWLALSAGIFMILLPLFLSHAYLSHAGEIALNTGGSFLLIFVHYSNYRSCKSMKE